MKWQAKDIDLYIQAREYVDTAIIPLIPNSWGDELREALQSGEFITLISDELERQFKGRVFQIPAVHYLVSEKLELRILRVKELAKHLKENGFAHIVYLTSDSQWKQGEVELDDTLLWLPTVPLEFIEEKQRFEIVSAQTKQIMPILANKWKK